MEPSQRRCRILIVGLGNVLLKDDGVGVHAVRELQKNPPDRLCVADVGTAVLHAVHLLEWAEKVIAIDAVKAGGAPGTIYAFDAGNERGEHRNAGPTPDEEKAFSGQAKSIPIGSTYTYFISFFEVE